jgi:hypothetical protein
VSRSGGGVRGGRGSEGREGRMRQHTSAYVSIRQRTSAYVSIRACMVLEEAKVEARAAVSVQ